MDSMLRRSTAANNTVQFRLSLPLTDVLDFAFIEPASMSCFKEVNGILSCHTPGRRLQSSKESLS